MKKITFNRVMILVVSIYFPLATLGSTGSYWEAVQMFLLLAVVMAIGVIEATERSIERSKGEMTLAEFDNTKWGANMFAEYKGKNYPVAACDFDERLIALEGVTLGSDTPDWVRCENVKLATSLTDVKEVLSKFKGKAN